MTHQKTCGRVVGSTEDGKRFVVCGEPMPCDVHRPIVRLLPWRCRWFGHAWREVHVAWARNWRCRRCNSFKAPCSNCGSVHDPATIVVCTIRRGVA